MPSSAGDSVGALAYIAPFIEHRRQGLVSDHIHLGYWMTAPTGPVSPAEWEAAQARLAGRLIGMADLRDGQDVADIGCGIGGTLRMILALSRPERLVGVNIDPDQLALCPTAGDGAWSVSADAVRLPFADASLDRVLCIEAAFHFASRKRFFAEACRALRPGGRLVVSDILIDPDRLPERERPGAEAALRRDFGPWPEPWTTAGDVERSLRDCGLRVIAREDATQATLPSYRVIAPDEMPALALEHLRATYVMRLLHERGILSYHLVAAVRDAAR